MRDVSIARRAAQAPPGPRDRLARPAPRHHGARDAGRADPPPERRARVGVRPHRRRVVRARPQRVPGDPAHGRDPGRELHGLPRRGRGGRVRPRDRRRGVGRRPLPAREPGAQADGVRLDDRLRGLAADARGRRPRGVPDGRLQRRDDRAHRALPADPRPGHLRRRPRRHRPRRLRARDAEHPRVDRAPLRVQRVRDRVRPDAADRATARRSGATSATGRTSAS